MRSQNIAVRLLKTLILGTAAWAACGVMLGAQAAKPYTPPKTAWGDPDLQGLWPSTDMVGVPLERPASFGARNEVTQEEYDTRAKHAVQRAAADPEETVSTAVRQGDGTGPPSHWLERGQAST